MLYIIGLGLGDKTDITVKGLEKVKLCDIIYLEYYTSKLATSVEELEKYYKKKIIVADRTRVEHANDILKHAKSKNVALLIIGDPFSATTHTTFLTEAKKQNITVEVIHNTSILTAVGSTGLFLYNFGKTTSIPFDNKNITTPIEVLKMNQKNNLHTLMLLDLDPVNNTFMTSSQAMKYVLKHNINPKTKTVICAGLGTKEQTIKVGTLEQLQELEIRVFHQCIIITGKKLHFAEEEALALYDS